MSRDNGASYFLMWSSRMDWSRSCSYSIGIWFGNCSISLCNLTCIMMSCKSCCKSMSLDDWWNDGKRFLEICIGSIRRMNSWCIIAWSNAWNEFFSIVSKWTRWCKWKYLDRTIGRSGANICICDGCTLSYI